MVVACSHLVDLHLCISTLFFFSKNLYSTHSIPSSVYMLKDPDTDKNPTPLTVCPASHTFGVISTLCHLGAILQF